jgi:hypothetical protein
MPVIGTPDKYAVWLDPNVNDFKTIRDILKPCDANPMRWYPVSRKLNNSKIDDADAASPVTLDTQLTGSCSSLSRFNEVEIGEAWCCVVEAVSSLSSLVNFRVARQSRTMKNGT